MSEYRQEIHRPWVVVHETPDGKLETIIAGPDGVGPIEFGIIIADCIKHVAAAFAVDNDHIISIVKKELELRPSLDKDKKYN